MKILKEQRPVSPSEDDNRKIPVLSIDLHDADGYVKSDYDVLRQKLNELGLYNDSYLYHAFSPKQKDTVLGTGTPYPPDTSRKNWLDCMEFDDFEHPIEGAVDFSTYLAFRARDFSYATFAVYRKDQFKLRELEGSEGTPPQQYDRTYYEFKDPDRKLDALVAVVIIEDYWQS